MIRAIILSACLATQASAADMATWGGGPFASVRLLPPEGDEVARVICRNELTSGHDTVLRHVLDLGGLSVVVDVTARPFTDPDLYEVTPPDGYVAIPPRVEVAEGETATILIFALDGMLMG